MVTDDSTIRLSPRLTRVRARQLDSPAVVWAGLAVLLLAGGAVLLYSTRGTTFWFDEWTWAFQRRGGSLSTLLDPHNGHFSLVPLAMYKVLFATVGMRHYTPYRVVVTAGQLAVVALLFTYLRGRTETWLAFVGAALILFFGPGWQDFLWPFQIAWLISVACGIGALMLLDRDDRLGRVLACMLVLLSIASCGVGVAIAIGVFVDLVLRPRGWRAGWVAGIPLVLYGLWSAGYQDTSIVQHGFAAAPDFAATLASSTMAALFGLGSPIQHGLTVDSGTMPQWGPPLLVAGVTLVVWRVAALRAIPVRAVSLAVIPLSFWLLIGLNRWNESSPFESRYLYVGAVFIILLAGELARGVRLSWLARVLIGLASLGVLLSNFGVLRNDATFLRQQTRLTRSEVGAFEITRAIVKPSFATGPLNSIDAGDYFRTARQIGSPAAAPAEVAAYPETVREGYDNELAAIHGAALAPARSAVAGGTRPALEGVAGNRLTQHGACLTLKPAAYSAAGANSGELIVRMPAGGVRISTGGGSTSVGYRRFAGAFQQLGTVNADSESLLRIGADASPVPWHLLLTPTATVTVCGLAS